MALHLNPNSSMINIMNPGNPMADSFAPSRVGDLVDRNSALSDMNPPAEPAAFKNQLSANFRENSPITGKKDEKKQTQAASALAAAALSPASMIQAAPINALIPDAVSREAIAHDLSLMALAAQAEKDSINQDAEPPTATAVASLEDLLIKEINQGASIKQLAEIARKAVQGKASADRLSEAALSSAAVQAEPDSMQAWLAQHRQEGSSATEGAILSHRPVSASTMQHLSGTDFLQTLSKSKSDPEKDASASASPVSDPQMAAAAAVGLDRAAIGLEKVRERDPAQRVELDSSGLAPVPGQNYSSIANTPATHAPVSLTGNVTLGAMAQNRLTSESIQALGASLQNINVSGRDAGTVRIRLNPGNMGEIYLKVQTIGDRVGLQVHAADDNARKVLEASLGDLRDQLATRNLHLAAVDIQTAQPTGGVSGSRDFGAELQQQGQNASQHNRQAMQDAWDGRQGGRRNDLRNWNLGNDSRIARPLASTPASRASLATAGAGRVDLFA